MKNFSLNRSNNLCFKWVAIVIALFINRSQCCSLLNGTFDFSPLKDVFPVVDPYQPGYRYDISLCQPLEYESGTIKENCVNSSICKSTNSTSLNMGNYSPIPDVEKSPINKHWIIMYLKSEKLCDGKDPAKSSINFMCGPHVGSPVLINYGDCSSYFSWRTLAACKNPPKTKQVRCYAVDNAGNKIDLSPLIKANGGYKVETKEKGDFIINVCSNISPDETTKKCPEGSAACRIENDEAVSYGSVLKAIKYTDGVIELNYENGTNSSTCVDRKTKIIFRCSHRSKLSSPRVISSSTCHYEVIWETDYACPEHMLTGNFKSCNFTDEEHGIDIDLRPLKKTTGYYNVTGQVNGTNRNFLFNVCSKLNTSICSESNVVAACMINPTTNTSEVIGTYMSKDLRYADSQLIMTYKKTVPSKTEMGEISTIIRFICSSEEDSEPQHIHSDNYTHLFEWKTIHACAKNRTNIPCYVYKDGRKIDLLRLSNREGHTNLWAVADVSFGTYYLLNVCQYNIGCGAGASFCLTNNNGSEISLGRFETKPYYDTVSDTTILKYTNGDKCKNNMNWSTMIYFICRPGHVNSHPTVTNIDEDQCTYHLEWYTTETCPLDTVEGKDCRLYNADLGLSFDLSFLKGQTFQFEEKNAMLYLSICEALSKSPCSDIDTGKNASACLMDKSTSKPKVIGEVSDTITYENGNIYLRYSHQKINTTLVFLCEPDEADHKWRLSRMDDDNIEIIWTTALVCNGVSKVDCTAHDPVNNKFYDLNSLSRADKNWEVFENDNNLLKKSYINVCRNLVPQRNCSRNSAVCVVNNQHGEELLYVPNAGSVLSGPQFVSEGHLRLTYSHGSPCNAYGQPTNYSTTIQFVCPNPYVAQSLKYLGKIGNCLYTYIWATKAACPSEDSVVQEKCYITNPENGFAFDISLLSRNTKPYVVNALGKTYHVNICGPVKGGCFDEQGAEQTGNFAVCEVKKDGKLSSPVAVSNGFLLRYSKEIGLRLEYKAQDKTPAVVITFPCSKETNSEMKFLRKEGRQYVFEMKTPLTCESEPFVCQFADEHGHEYDLTPLMRSNNNAWIAKDSRQEYQHMQYHISFCQPLNNFPATSCSGDVAVCQLNTSSKAAVNLGSYYMPPTLSEEGIITMIFAHGQKCRGLDDLFMTTHVTLRCSNLQGPLVFIGETPDCEYIFDMQTPAACPLTINYGSNCSVTDPVFGHIFDLNPLQSVSPTIDMDPFTYTLKVCGALDNVSGECNGSAACQTKASDAKFAKSMGLPSSKLIYNDGILTLVYDSGSGPCHDKFQRSTVITFTCDHNASLSNSKPFFVAENENCTYMFEWPTVYACPPFSTIDCSVEDDHGHLYDLTPLALTDGNYYVRYQDTTFAINVCRNVIHSGSAVCPYSSAACKIDNASKRGVNIGEARAGPHFTNGILQLQYNSGDRCVSKGDSNQMFMKSVIDFKCDRKRLHSEPQFIGVDSCTYHFEWSTAYACYHEEPIPTGNCTFSAPITGFMYDLSSLRSNSSYIVDSGKHKFHINVCGPVKGSSCESSQTGVCQEEIGGTKRKWNAGNANGDLSLRNGVLSLNYSSGALCHKGKFKRNTIIEFHCGEDKSLPEFQRETSECTYYFAWETQLACNPFVHCAVKNGSDHFDLSPLTMQHYYVVKPMSYIDNATYYISVCDQLGVIPNVPCPPEAAICRVPNNGQPESVGKAEYPPMIGFNSQAYAIYTNGNVACPTSTDGERQYKHSHILFLCDPNVIMGEPVLMAVDRDCTYIFEWRTSLVCPSIPVKPEPTSCMYKDPQKGIFFDLARATRDDSYYEVKDESGSYLLNVCHDVSSSNLTNCQQAGSCFQSANSSSAENYGLSASQNFSYDGYRLRLTISDGDDCPFGTHGKKSTVIFFTCNPKIEIGHPSIYKKYQCLTVFFWETSLVCRDFQHECALYIDNNFYDLHPLSKISDNWSMSDKKGNKYWLNLCRGIQQTESTMGCPPSAAVCMQDSQSSHLPLGLVNTISMTKMNASTLVLTYKSFTSLVCPNGKMNATSRIFLNCNKSLGSPKLLIPMPPDDKCFYDFIWETSLACVEKAEEIELDNNGFLYENDLNYSMDLNPILNKTFNVSGSTNGEIYWYLINLSGINTSEVVSTNDCSKAAVCQTKNTGFSRNVGSFSSKKFYKQGSELHLVLKSSERSCGKKKSRYVTTVFNMHCSTAGNSVGKPKFLYESTGCDYMFEWGTYAVCSKFHRPDRNNSTNDKHLSINDDITPHSSHKTAIVITLLFFACIGCFIVFILSKADRRAVVASKFRSCFSSTSMPRFRYKRSYSNLNPPSAIAYRSSSTNLLQVEFLMPSRSSSFDGKSSEHTHGDRLTELQSDF